MKALLGSVDEEARTAVPAWPKLKARSWEGCAPKAAGSGMALGRVRWWRGEEVPRFFSVAEAASASVMLVTLPERYLDRLAFAGGEKSAMI
ncbi:hypothetical protein [Roseateles puraquae]|uniref:hypothetical protein n=1 Tax=Roseateles puraquae TaxID=431059 RepID=UPI0031DCAD67